LFLFLILFFFYIFPKKTKMAAAADDEDVHALLAKLSCATKVREQLRWGEKLAAVANVNLKLTPLPVLVGVIMNLYRSNEMIAGLGCVTISALLEPASRKLALPWHGVVEPILGAMRRFNDSIALLHVACAALDVVVRDRESAHAAFVACGGAEATVSLLLRRTGTHLHELHWACVCVLAATFRCRELRDRFWQMEPACGVIDAIDAMSAEPDVLFHGVVLLGQMCLDAALGAAEPTAVLLRASALTTKVLDVMDANRHNVRLLVYACTFLWVVGAEDRARGNVTRSQRSRGHATVTAVLDQHAEHDGLVNMARRALDVLLQESGA
jgi:hypothetical protein